MRHDLINPAARHDIAAKKNSDDLTCTAVGLSGGAHVLNRCQRITVSGCTITKAFTIRGTIR